MIESHCGFSWKHSGFQFSSTTIYLRKAHCSMCFLENPSIRYRVVVQLTLPTLRDTIIFDPRNWVIRRELNPFHSALKHILLQYWGCLLMIDSGLFHRIRFKIVTRLFCPWEQVLCWYASYPLCSICNRKGTICAMIVTTEQALIVKVINSDGLGSI